MTGESKLAEDFDADALNADVLANKTDEQLTKLTDDIGTYESVTSCSIMGTSKNSRLSQFVRV